MNKMRILFTAIVLIIANYATAQQVNPVPDYVFSNRMSVGRNAVTDTAAYFSIGPRYGANKGFMPPIVGDTAHVTASNKRNGLLIFSVQKNKFLYWDSVRVQWSDMAGSSGSYIVAGDTAAMLSPYVRHAGYGLTKSGQSFLVDTAAIATRARVQKGIDSVSSFVVKLTGNQTIAGNKTFSNDATFSGNINLFGALAAFNELNTAYTSYLKSRASAVSQFLYLPGDTGNLATERFVNSKFSSTVSGTTNYVPKFTSSTVLGNSQIFDNGTNVGIGTATPISGSVLDVTGSTNIYPRIRSTGTGEAFQFYQNSNSGTTAGDGLFVGINSGNDAFFYNAEATPARFFTSGSERMRITSDGNVGIGTTSPSYKLQVTNTSGESSLYLQSGTTTQAAVYFANALNAIYNTNSTTNELKFYVNSGDRMMINSSGELLIGTTTDAGAYALQVAGSIYNTTGAVLAASSGIVGVGTTATPSASTVKFITKGSGVQDSYIQIENGSGGGGIIGSNNGSGLQIYGFTGSTGSESYTKRLEINSTGETLLGGGTDAGAYALQVAGSIYNTTGAVLAASSGEVLIGTASDAGAFALQVQGDVLFSGGVKTAQPTGGTAGRWRLGEAATVSPTSPNRTIRVEIEGTVYYIHAKTTND